MTKELIEKMMTAWRESFCDLDDGDPTPAISESFVDGFQAAVNALLVNSV